MNKKSWMVLRIVAGMYLAFLGIQIISQVSKEQPTNLALMMCAAVLFIGVGVAYAGAAIRNVWKMGKGDASEEELQIAEQDELEVEPQETHRDIPDIQLKQDVTEEEQKEESLSKEEEASNAE